MTIVTTPYRASSNLIWSCRFSGPSELAKLGGAIAGSPVFTGDGLEFDGMNDGVEFYGRLMDLSKIKTVKLTFTPQWAIDSGNFMLLQLRGDGTDVNRNIYQDGTFLSSYVDGSYKYQSQANLATNWRQGEKNTLIMVWKSGAIAAYLNGNILASSANTFLHDDYDTKIVVVAQQFGGGLHCEMSAHEVSLFDSHWTQDEVTDDYNNATFRFKERASLWLDMKSSTQDPSGTYNVTPDKSKYGCLAKLGDGLGSNAPDFKNPGFEFNGTTDHIEAAGDGVYNHDAVSIAIGFVPYFAANSTGYIFLCDSTNGARYYVLRDNGIPSLIVQLNNAAMSIVLANYEPHWKQHGFNVLVATCETGAQSAYLNGHLVWSGADAYTPADPAFVYVGAYYMLASYSFDGVIDHFSVYPSKLTPTQVRDLSSYLQQEYTHV